MIDGRKAEEQAFEMGWDDATTERILAGREARERLIEANLGLVHTVLGRYPNAGGVFEYDDAAQEATIGLMTAVDRFDPDRGFKFSTYAWHWILASIQEVDHGARTVQLPRSALRAKPVISRVEAELTQSLGRAARADEIAERLDLPLTTVQACLDTRADLYITASGEDADWIDTQIDYGRTVVSGVIAADEDPTAPHEADDLHAALLSLLDVLTPREKAMVLEVNGFNSPDRTKPPLGAVAEQYGISADRVSRICRNAMSKLRHPAARHGLHLFLT